MGEYEPRDSRNVTLSQDRAPGEPPRTGPREQETSERESARPEPRSELAEDGRGAEVEPTAPAGQEALRRERSMQIDTDELNAAEAARRPRGA